MDRTENLESALDTVEQNEEGNKEQTAAKESKEDEQKEDAQIKMTKRRISTKVTPNLEIARKKMPKEDRNKSENRYEMLKDLEEMD